MFQTLGCLPAAGETPAFSGKEHLSRPSAAAVNVHAKHARMHACAHTRARTLMHACNTFTHTPTRMCAHTHARVHAFSCTHPHMHAHARTHACTHTHTHTHTHTCTHTDTPRLRKELYATIFPRALWPPVVSSNLIFMNQVTKPTSYQAGERKQMLFQPGSVELSSLSLWLNLFCLHQGTAPCKKNKNYY